MSFEVLGFEVGRSDPLTRINVAAEVEDAPRSKNTNTINSRVKTVNMRVKDKGFDYDGMVNSREKLFDPPEYDLGRIARAMDTDAYIRQVLIKYAQSIFRRGWDLNGENPETVSYIRARIRQMEDVTDMSFDSFLDEGAEQLVNYHNLFIAKVRNEDASGGMPWTDFTGKERIPIAGYFTQDATTIEISRMQQGGIVKNYRQVMPGFADSDLPLWPKDDMIHIHLDRKVGLAYGCPMIVPVLADIMALRRIEENIELLVFQYAIPFIQYKIGFPNSNEYDPGEIDKVQRDIRDMVTEGMFVTPPHHEIKAVGVEGRAIRAEGYLKYFKSRVFSGLGTSSIGMGEGDTASRATANHLTRNEANMAERYARTLCRGISHHMFRELLNEGGYDTRDDNNLVYLVVPPIDIDQQMALENHFMALYQGGQITEDEMRLSIGRSPITYEQRNKMYLEVQKLPLTLMQSIDEAVLAGGGQFHSLSQEANSDLANLGNRAQKAQINRLSASAENATSVRNQPENQSGKKAAKTLPINDMQDALNPDSTSYSEELQQVYDIQMVDNLADQLGAEYEISATDTLNYVESTFLQDKIGIGDLTDSTKNLRKSRIKMSMQMSKDRMLSQYNLHCQHAYNQGLTDIANQVGKDVPLTTGFAGDLIQVHNMAENSINLLVDDVTTRVVKAVLDSNETIELLPSVRGVFNASKYRLESFSRSHLHRAFVLGQLHAADALGFEDIEIAPAGNITAACTPPKAAKVTELGPQNIPPYHPNCTQVIKVSGGRKG